MSSKKTLVGLTMATLALGLSGALGAGSMSSLVGTSAEAAGGGLRCEIQAVSRNGGIDLSAIVSAAGPASGTYRFTVRQGGSGGGSNVNQAGEFSLGSGGKSVVGEISLGSGTSYSAELSVSSGKGVGCHDRHSSWL